ncbi:hypothetical protein FFK22_011530 [Mycobacterium sp. KBS0706]|uniref:hypothetical protein n=1 Tax=Mycobacterium sp. KBS0706 TaxID=2578109 RepID=UPI00110FA2F3|nr:hypothetical protein [Mycobacterium sp. KBS0706]TSD88679.1 hypothetical protein FFK22_011530 [Mycobacterium sp. KBS0706]
MPAEAQIRDIFTLTGRGTILLLEHGFSGRIRIGQTVSSEHGQATVLGVELGRPAFVGVLVDILDAREIFRPGDALRFTDPAEDTSS